MSARNIGGAIAMAGSTGLIGYALHITHEPKCLWAIILVVILGANFPWEKSK